MMCFVSATGLLLTYQHNDLGLSLLLAEGNEKYALAGLLVVVVLSICSLKGAGYLPASVTVR